MAKENRARYAVLGMLHYGNMTGYEIRNRITTMVGYFWQEPNASVYPTLKTLEEEGCVTGVRELPSSGPSRVRYTITPLGRQAFAAWIHLAPQPTAMRNEFALKVLFGNLTDTQTILGFLQEELQKARQVEANLGQVINSLPQGNESLLWRLIADYGRTIAESTAAWCERAQTELGAVAKGDNSVK